MFRRMLGLLLAALLLAGAWRAPAEAARTIWHVTDLHHLSPALTDYGALFERLMRSGDGKLTEHSGEIVDALVAVALARRPDAIVITGDLTFNGERESLDDLLSRLMPLREAGIPALLMPGNHDINYPYARRYYGDTAYMARNMRGEEFIALCAGFGWDEALARDEGSMSYIWAMDEGTWLLLLDANAEDAPGAVKESTLSWLKTWLTRAQAEGVTVLSFTHQNVLPVNPVFKRDFLIANCEEVLRIYRECGVTHNFSGHAHVNHVTEEGGLTEAVTGAVCVSPLTYGVIALDGGVTYAQAALDVFADEAAARFRETVLLSMDELLEALGMRGEAKTRMAEFAAALNQAYFAGNVDAAMRDDPAWDMWQRAALGTKWLLYMRSMFE